MRLYLVAYLLAFNMATVGAQPPKESVPPTASTPRALEDESKVIYQLEVSPAAEPRPAMKYRLLPNPTDLKPGNAATQYYKAFLLGGTPPTSRKEYGPVREYIDVPLRKIDLAELGRALELVLAERVFFESIRAATYRVTCDWEEPLEEQGVHLPLPAVSELRSTGILLAVKAKYEVGRGDYEGAIATARDTFTLASRLQKDGELVIQAVVGVAIVGMMHDEVFLEWIQSPGSPNLYWALSEVPDYFDSRQVISGDLRSVEYTLPGLKDIGGRVFTVEEAGQLAANAFAVNERWPPKPLDQSDAKRRAQLAAWALETYDESYRELADAGYSRALVDQMPVLQVALLGRWKRYEQHRDDLYKWTTVVYGSGRELALRKQREIQRQADVSTTPFGIFFPALEAMFRTQLRQHRFVCGLRAIEALRLHAAAHGGFPDTLTDIRDVPVPNDPVTRAPFVYRGGGKSATLTMIRHELGADMEYEYRLRLRDAGG
jgi:hypothetical protein